MSNQFGFLSDDTFAEKMDTMNQFLAAIATGQGGSLKPTSWSDVERNVTQNQTVLNLRYASELFQHLLHNRSIERDEVLGNTPLTSVNHRGSLLISQAAESLYICTLYVL